MTRPGASLIVALVSLGVSSCVLDSPDPDGPSAISDLPLTISGRLTTDFGCYLLRGDRIYELYYWDGPVPPLGSQVSLRVKAMRNSASVCMVGVMVDVIEILDVRVDFRTEDVVTDEVWKPEDDIVLGQVEVKPGATLTVLPGTVIHIIPEGELLIRGRIIMEGALSDSIRIEGVPVAGWGNPFPGPVVFDSVAAGSSVRFVTTPSPLRVRGEAPLLERIRGGISVDRGTAFIRDSDLSSVGARDATVALENNRLGGVDGLHASLTLQRNVVRDLTLSYSQASAHENFFSGDRSTIMFGGVSGGTIERNTFEADSTSIEVRHTSDPVFQQNNFVSSSTKIECESYSGPCLQFVNNWWGTTEEAEIRARFVGPCDFCYSPWLTVPVVW
jgi:hypothetical protein